MQKQILFFLLIFTTVNICSQIKFENGYFINNSGQKVDCLINNIDWQNNPTKFNYKLSENDDSNTLNIENVKEFGILNVSKYVRARVNIDRSSENRSRLSKNKEPVFKEEQLFLKVLVEGKASLFFFQESNLKRYFYTVNKSNINQLIFKSYQTENYKIGINNKFRQQLWRDLRCSQILQKEVENIDYKKKSLINLFVKYNNCNNVESVNFEKKQEKSLFNINIRPGINSSSLTTKSNNASVRSTTFDNEFSFRLGVEIEYILPYNKNKWGIIVEPTYQYYSSEKNINTLTAKVDYKSIQIPIGVRHYFFLNNNSKIFINTLFVFDITNNSKIDFDRGIDFEIKTNSNFAFGIGYKYNDKFSIEYRYNLKRNILVDYSSWTSEFKSMSIILGYTIF